MSQAIHATVVSVSKKKTGEGATKIVLEIPIEFYKFAAQWDDMRVLLVQTNIDAPFGPVTGEGQG